LGAKGAAEVLVKATQAAAARTSCVLHPKTVKEYRDMVEADDSLHEGVEAGESEAFLEGDEEEEF